MASSAGMIAGRAVYAYAAQEEDELSIDAGESLDLLGLNEEGWWLARQGDRVGIVPANYVCTEVHVDAHGDGLLGRSGGKKDELFKLAALGTNSTSLSTTFGGGGDMSPTIMKADNKKNRLSKEKDELLRIKEQRIQADEKIQLLRNKVSTTERNNNNSNNNSSNNNSNNNSNSSNNSNSNYISSLAGASPEHNNDNSIGDRGFEENEFSKLLSALENVLSDFSDSPFTSAEYGAYQSIKSLVLKSAPQVTLSKKSSIISQVVVADNYQHYSIGGGAENGSSQQTPVKKNASPLKINNGGGGLSFKSNANISPYKVVNAELLAANTNNGGEVKDPIRYNNCRSTIYAPSIIPDQAMNGPAPKKLRLQHVYGYDGDRTRHANAALNKNIAIGQDNVALFPSASVVVAVNLSTNTQSFYSGHKEDVVCVAVHPSRPLAVSGEIGKPGRVLVWDYNFMRLSRDSFSENNTITELFVGDECRGVRSVSFSGDGRFILCLGLDDSNTIVIFDWSAATIVATAKLGHPEVSQINFNNFLFNSIDRISDHQTLSPRSSMKSSELSSFDQVEDLGCYTIVSCGGKFIKFWTLTRTSTRRDDPNNSTDASSFKGRQLAIPKYKQNIVVKYDLVGNIGVSPKNSAESVEFTSFVCTNNMSEKGTQKKSKVLAGTAVGSIYIWSQLETDSSSNKSMFTMWQARGRLLSVVTDVHDKPIVDMSYFFKWDETTNKPIDRLATSGTDAMINVWDLGDIADLTSPPIRFSAGLNLDDASLMYGYARSICWNNNGRDVIVGTVQNNVVFIPNMDITSDNNIDKDLIQLLVSGHCGKVRKVAVHPQEYLFCSISSDKTLRFWDSIGKKAISIIRVKDERASCLSFSPKGDTLIVGNEFGEISIWNCKIVRSESKGSKLVGTIVSVDLSLQARKNVSSKVGVDSGNVLSNRRQRQKTEVLEVKYSPSGNVLAVACRDNLIHILSLEANYKRLSVCRGHSSHVRSLDFSVDGTILQSTDASRELLYWEVASGKVINTPSRIRDLEWQTWTCMYGWPVQGIFNGDAGLLIDGDINSVSRSYSQDLVVTGGSNRYSVKLFSYPCLQGSIAKQYTGHSSPVQDAIFMVGDSHVITSGGNDTSVFQWEVVPDNY